MVMHFIPTLEQEAWIKSKVESGDYANASEVLREVLRERIERERRRETKLTDLKTALDEAEASEIESWEGAEAIIKIAREHRAAKAKKS
jgi:putative addiction module CopG family antidote